jgi:hypothetical protein
MRTEENVRKGTHCNVMNFTYLAFSISFEKFVNVYFLLSWGLACHKTFSLEEEAPENSKEFSHSAHETGMNE